MIPLQEDLIKIYNSLTEFSNLTLGIIQSPIKVGYSTSLNSLCFEQGGTRVCISELNYYCKNLKKLKDTYLLPDDYDILMMSLTGVIHSGSLLHDRVCVSPEEFGFSIYDVGKGVQSLKEGPQLKAKIKFVSGNSWLFKKLAKHRYERF